MVKGSGKWTIILFPTSYLIQKQGTDNEIRTDRRNDMVPGLWSVHLLATSGPSLAHSTTPGGEGDERREDVMGREKRSEGQGK